jgi:DNA invertase Pin-like site-specific DNA recombinase
MTVFAYVRVSTEEQENGPAAQRALISAAVTVDEWFEDHVSGKNLKRPQLQALLARVSKGDTIVVTKVDRLSRSVLDFATLMTDGAKVGWTINVLELGLDPSSPMGAAMVQMMAVFAELERKLIGQRTKDGMAIVKQRGPAPGKKPIGAPRQYGDGVASRIIAIRATGLSYREIGKSLGISHSTVKRICDRA